jgi:hypothetical protein
MASGEPVVGDVGGMRYMLGERWYRIMRTLGRGVFTVNDVGDGRERRGSGGGGILRENH